MPNIGFLGLGIMGLPMAVNLVKKCGFPVKGTDVSPSQMEKFIADGGCAAADAAELFAWSDILFFCLPTNELMRDNARAAMEAAKPGTVIVDLGSTAPGIIRGVEAELRSCGMHLLDSPVSGGDIGAKAGTLAIMAGGEKEVFDKVEPLLRCMGSAVTYMGKSANGSTAKLANNMMAGAYLAIMGEAFAFAVKAGLDPTVLYNAIKDGYAGCKMLDVKLPKIVNRDFSPAARMAVHQKDLKNAVLLAEEMGVKIPMSQVTLDLMDEVEAMGKANEDQCAMCQVYERDMGVIIQ